MAPIGRTIILCRPEQDLEAAIVASCLGGAEFTPIFILNPAPVSNAEYDALYTDMVEAQRRSMVTAINPELHGQKPEQVADALATMVEHRRAHIRLSEPRSWAKGNRLLRGLLHKLKPERAVLLFEPATNDLQMEFGTDELASNDTADTSLLPPDLPRTKFIQGQRAARESGAGELCCYQDIAELSDLAWTKLRGTPPPRDGVASGPRNSRQLLSALAHALERDLPLRASTGSAVAVPERVSASEGVLVEEGLGATGVIAVLYARHRGAALVIVPTPDLSAIQETVRTFQVNQEEETKALGYAHANWSMLESSGAVADQDAIALSRRVQSAAAQLKDVTYDGFDLPRLLEALRNLVIPDWRTEVLRRLEEQVTAHMPLEAFTLLANLPVTAFTAGVPYNFAHLGSDSWRNKPVGHVAFDPSLVVTADVALEVGEKEPNLFSVVFDPGFFRTPETQLVREALDRHQSHAITLSQLEATTSALHLPLLELCFFNTHGSDHSILIGSFPLTRELVAQWVRLSSGPIVFNNSCLSWTGVGKEFIRAGARGYIGTLWSVDASRAAVVAGDAMRRMVDGVPVAAAIRGLAEANLNDRAYIYSGTASGRMRRPNTTGVGWNTAYAHQAAMALVSVLLELCSASDRIASGAAWGDEPLASALYRELVFFRSKMQDMDPGTDETFGVLHGELSLLSGRERIFKRSPKYSTELATQFLSELEKHGARKAEARPLVASVLSLRARARTADGSLGDARADYEQAIAIALASGDEAFQLHCLLELIEVVKISGEAGKGRELGLEALELARKLNQSEAIMIVTGKLGQLAKRLNNIPEALSMAREGFAAAVKAENLHEQAAFKIDEAHACHLLGELDVAIEAALEAGKVSRAMQSPVGDMKAYGVVGQCYRSKRDFVRAREFAERGLVLARRLGDRYEEAGFLSDLGVTAQAEGSPRDAAEYWMAAVVVFESLGRIEATLPLLNRLARSGVDLRDWTCLQKVVYMHLTALLRLSESDRGPVAASLLYAVMLAIRVAPAIRARMALEGWRMLVGVMAASSTTRGDRKEGSEVLEFLLFALGVLLAWFNNDGEAAARGAVAADNVTGNTLKFSEFVNQPAPKITIWQRVIYWLESVHRRIFSKASRPPKLSLSGAGESPPASGH